jgi:hypothetical protein
LRPAREVLAVHAAGLTVAVQISAEQSEIDRILPYFLQQTIDFRGLK